jgi:glutathione S-transferase
VPLLRQDPARPASSECAVALHDAKNDPIARDRLLAGGGKIKVPCLHIQEGGQSRWLYESNAIIAYLEQRFAGIA